tara:strand:+ start:71 stop:883 length:813 start_codon:yes stop_codon:yes gene_type:complete
MSINYVYMPTNTAFEANALNLRFETFMGTAQGLNALTPEDLMLGAFRHNHVPRLLQREDYTYEQLYASLGPSMNRFSVMRNTLFDSGSGVSDLTTVLTHTQTYPFVLGMATNILPERENIAAIIVLANICIEQFIMKQGSQGTSYPREDKDYVLASLWVEDSTGKNEQIPKTVRALSPRITISVTAPYNGFKEAAGGQSERRTDQDIAIRSVITLSDLAAAGLSDVQKVHLKLEPSKPGLLGGLGVDKVQYSKANLTVIPIHAKLNQIIK